MPPLLLSRDILLRAIQYFLQPYKRKVQYDRGTFSDACIVCSSPYFNCTHTPPARHSPSATHPPCDTEFWGFSALFCAIYQYCSNCSMKHVTIAQLDFENSMLQLEWWIWPNLWSGSPLLSLPDQVSPSTLHCFRTHFKTLDVSYCTALRMWVLYFHRQVYPCAMPGLLNSLNPAIPDWRTWSKFGEHG